MAGRRGIPVSNPQSFSLKSTFDVIYNLLKPKPSHVAFGEAYHFMGKPQAAKPDDLAFAASFWALTEDLLRQDRLRLGPLVHRREGGLAAVPEGLGELKAGGVAAGKLVYTIVNSHS